MFILLTDDENSVDSQQTAIANGTWKQGRQLLRQSVYFYILTS